MSILTASDTEGSVIIRKTNALKGKTTLSMPFKKYAEQFKMLYFSDNCIPISKDGVLSKTAKIRKDMIKNLFRQGKRNEVNYLNIAVLKSIPCNMNKDDVLAYNIESGRIQKEAASEIIKEHKFGKNIIHSVQHNKDISLEM